MMMRESSLSHRAAEESLPLQDAFSVLFFVSVGMLFATPDTFGVRKMTEVARMLRPAIEVVVRTHSDEEAELLRAENIGRIFMGEHELALGMTEHVLERMNHPQSPLPAAASPQWGEG